MYSSTVLFVVLFSSLSQQLLGEEDHANFLRRRNEGFKARQTGGEDDSFCYGVNAICAEMNSLFSDCDSFSSQADDTQWFQCLCGNGYMATYEA
jgi:hypothetical protein